MSSRTAAVATASARARMRLPPLALAPGMARPASDYPLARLRYHFPDERRSNSSHLAFGGVRRRMGRQGRPVGHAQPPAAALGVARGRRGGLGRARDRSRLRAGGLPADAARELP